MTLCSKVPMVIEKKKLKREERKCEFFLYKINFIYKQCHMRVDFFYIQKEYTNIFNKNIKKRKKKYYKANNDEDIYKNNYKN